MSGIVNSGGITSGGGGGLNAAQAALLAQIPNKQDKDLAAVDGNFAIFLNGETVDSGIAGSGNNKGYFVDLTALQTAYPVGQDGWYAILGSTDTVWTWDSNTAGWVDTDTKGQVQSVNGQTGTVVLDQSDIDIQGTFTPNNAPIVTADNGKTSFEKAQGQIDDIQLIKQDKIYDYTVADLTALNALTGMTAGQTAVTLDTLKEYIYTTQWDEVFVQADWTQTDNTQPDYIKNKPVADVLYDQVFNNNTDWGVASGGDYIITILASAHGKGIIDTDNVSIQELLGGQKIPTDGFSIDNTTGDVTIIASEIPDGRYAFEIKIGLITGFGGSGGDGISTIGNINSQTKSANGAVIFGNQLIMQDADDNGVGNGGLVNVGYQTFFGAKTNRNDNTGSVKGAGMYNADTTDNNGITFNVETDTTGAGAQTGFATTFISTNFKDHNAATVTAEFGISTYIDGVQKTVLQADENLNLYTDFLLNLNNGLNLNGDLNVNNGFARAGKQLDVLTGQGFNQGMNSLGGQIVVPAGTPITGTNIFGTNLAQGFIWSDDMDGGVIPFLGASAVAYVGYMAGLVAGKTMETINMSVAGLSDQGSVAGAVVNNINMYVAGGLIGGTPATVNNMRMYYVPAIAGGIATNEWGVCIDAALDNYLDKSLTIGGGAGSKTTNPDIALEVKSKKAIKFPSLTTAEKNAIASAESGMMIYDETLGKMCFYSGLSNTWETITSI